jgi:hypothetical protein
MADFVAVIRKAVDGLANNTPENRAKVYDKARSAVVRQLENMKPRPPEELLKRQILKLDTAIAEVENEYAEALPPLEDEEYAPDAIAPAAAPYYDEPTAEEQHRYVEPEPQAAPVAYVEEEREPEPEYAQPVPAPVAAPEETHFYASTQEDERRYDAVEEPETVAETQAEPEAEEDHAHQSWVGQDTAREEEWSRQDDHVAKPEEHARAERHDEAEEVLHENTPLPYATTYAAQPYHQEVSFEPEPRIEPRHGEEPVRAAPASTFDEDVFGAPEPLSEPRKQAPAPVEDFSTYFQDAALDLPAKTSPTLPRADDDPFAVQPRAKDDKERSPWDDLEDLIGYDGSDKNNSSNQRADNGYDSGIVSEGIPASAYMTKKKPRRNYAALVLSVCGIALLGGGAYALWMNRDALNDMVGGLVQSAQTETASAPPANTPASTPASTPATQPSTPAATQQNQASTQPPAATNDDGSVTGTKFTQRLLADGSEKDEGAGPGPNGQPVTAEGQSVYQQNEAPAAPAAGTAAATPGATPPATETAQAQPPAAAAAKGERMFLYEEVLGQTVPTAIEGNVAWSLQSEADADGKSSPTVQGQLSIPGRGLSALITFKRNTDPSLPASHLVEIVFSVSPGFEGGAIDSVQRIAMKSTEQDRGNALIAVPAKITDDFHMIALNDFPDALKTNLELMRTRDWIDIPVSYRNGRRALLTMQKGPEGKAAFETALREWSAAAPATGQ